MQQTLNRISHNPDQPALCDGLSQRANRLADELQRAEFLVRDPALQKPWSIARHDPRVIEYMAAKLKVEMTLPARADRSLAMMPLSASRLPVTRKDSAARVIFGAGSNVASAI